MNDQKNLGPDGVTAQLFGVLAADRRPAVAEWARLQADALAADEPPRPVELAETDAAFLGGFLAALDALGLPGGLRAWARDQLATLHRPGGAFAYGLSAPNDHPRTLNPAPDASGGAEAPRTTIRGPLAGHG